MLLVALTIAPVALLAGTAWFAWRFLSYASATIVDAEIVDWRHDLQTGHAGASVAYAQMQFIDVIGRERLVWSTLGIPTDNPIAASDTLPVGPVRLRYRRWPFLALEDDRSVWFSGPAILLATAILGTMLKLLFRFTPLAWLMGS
jgi:hypothetical protein